MDYIVEQIIPDYEKNMAYLFCQNTHQIFYTKIPNYPSNTVLRLSEDQMFHVAEEQETVEKIIDLFYTENPLISLNKMNELYQIIQNTKQNIYQSWLKHPYSLYKLKRKDDTDILSIKDICHNFIPYTFDLFVEEIEFLTYWIIKKNKTKTGSSYFPLKDIYNQLLTFYSSCDKNVTFIEFVTIIAAEKDFFYLNTDVIRNDTIIALKQDFLNESTIYYSLQPRLHQSTPFPNYQSHPTDYLNEQQQNAVDHIILQDGLASILTGGPGTGKTTSLKEIVLNLQTAYPNEKIALLAPTGRAVKRLKEVMGDLDVITKTIHKFLGYRMGENTYVLPSVKAEIQSVHCIIIDEFSMVGSSLFSFLLNSIDLDHTKIILTGDIHQLPSIDSGALLRDLIHMGVPVYELNINHRSAEAQTIIQNSKKINEQQMDFILDDSFQIIEHDFFDDINSILQENDAVVLSPYRTEKITTSTVCLNQYAHKQLFHDHFQTKFHIMEQVIVTHTKYDKKGLPYYINGELGTIRSILLQTDQTYHYIVDIEGDYIEIPEGDLDYSYALTIHKAQGSEFDTVYIVIPEYSDFITKGMFYTAVTRAKKKVYIYSSLEVIQKIIHNNIDMERHTLLEELQFA